MRDERRHYAVAGGFVVLMLAALLGWISLLSGRTGATHRYFVEYQRVHGLEADTKVFFDGYPVGRIEEITPLTTEGRRSFRVKLRIGDKWTIPDDSLARVSAQGLLARVVIDIRGGSSATPIPPDGTIRGEEASDVFAAAGTLVARVAELVEELRPLAATASKDAPAILANVESFTAELDRASDQLAALLSDENVARVGRTLAHMEAASGSLSDLSRNLEATRAEAHAVLARVNALVREDRGELSSAASDLEHSLAAVARHIDAIAADLETSSRNLTEFTRQVREDPGVIVRGREREDGAQP